MSIHEHSSADSHIGGFGLALGLTLAFACIEAAGGLWSGSLALLSDAGHMFTDSLGLVLATIAAKLAARPISQRHSFGYARAEVICAFLNSLIMIGLIISIIIGAIIRLKIPHPVQGGYVFIIASIGLATNLAIAWSLSKQEDNINIRAALLHVLGDMLGSIAALIAGAVIFFTGYLAIDPILSLAVAGLILWSAIRLLRESLHILMEGVPTQIDINTVAAGLMKHAPAETEIHDIHIWTLTSGSIALSAHVRINNLALWPELLPQLCKWLAETWGIKHITLQPEPLWQKISFTPYADWVRKPLSPPPNTQH
ncbi:MAG: cation transporter [Pseudomonadota bacterium]|nr:cation transporter [Pseudomonadota bacterium]